MKYELMHNDWSGYPLFSKGPDAMNLFHAQLNWWKINTFLAFKESDVAFIMLIKGEMLTF